MEGVGLIHEPLVREFASFESRNFKQAHMQFTLGVTTQSAGCGRGGGGRAGRGREGGGRGEGEEIGQKMLSATYYGSLKLGARLEFHVGW